jgi:nucleotide-binding universal stress UspA family protein
VRVSAGTLWPMAARARRIIVGYDGSEASTRALDLAADLAGYGSTLAVVTVAEGREDAVGDRVLGDARERLVSRHVSASYLRPVGEPAETLVETANSLEADLLVVGRRDQNALQRLVLGSVSAKVVNRAHCDVLVVR